MAFTTEPPRILSVDEILQSEDLVTLTVPVPEWGGAVKVRGLSLQQVFEVQSRSTFTNKATGKEETNSDLAGALTFIYGVVEPKFELDQWAMLKGKSVRAMMRVIKEINALSGTSNEAFDEATKSLETRPALSILDGARPRTGDDTGGTLATDVGL